MIEPLFTYSDKEVYVSNIQIWLGKTFGNGPECLAWDVNENE